MCIVSEKFVSLPATLRINKFVVNAKMQAIAVIKMPNIIPLYWKAQGIVTVPQPIIAFHVLKTIMRELILPEELSYLSPSS